MVWERYQRTHEEQIAVKLAHSSRIVSDVCAFAKFRLRQLLIFCDIDTKIIQNIENKYQALFEELEKAGENFNKYEYASN